MKSDLPKYGLTELENNRCEFPVQVMIIISYAADLLLFAKTQRETHRLKAHIGIRFKIRDSVVPPRFPGIQMERKQSNTVALRQSGVIQRLLQAQGTIGVQFMKILSKSELMRNEDQGVDSDGLQKVGSHVESLLYLVRKSQS